MVSTSLHQDRCADDRLSRLYPDTKGVLVCLDLSRFEALKTTYFSLKFTFDKVVHWSSISCISLYNFLVSFTLLWNVKDWNFCWWESWDSFCKGKTCKVSFRSLLQRSHPPPTIGSRWVTGRTRPSETRWNQRSRLPLHTGPLRRSRLLQLNVIRHVWQSKVGSIGRRVVTLRTLRQFLSGIRTSSTTTTYV